MFSNTRAGNIFDIIMITSSFSKCRSQNVICPHKNAKLPFSEKRVRIAPFSRRINVDGRSHRRNKSPFSKSPRVEWRRPKLNNGALCFSWLRPYWVLYSFHVDTSFKVKNLSAQPTYLLFGLFVWTFSWLLFCFVVFCFWVEVWENEKSSVNTSRHHYVNSLC